MPSSVSSSVTSSKSSTYMPVSAISKTKLFVSKAEPYITQKNGECYYKFGVHIRTRDSCFSLPHSLVRRRYSEFCWLRKNLRDVFYIHHVQIPELPSRGLFRNRNDPNFLEDRRLGLEKFLLNVLAESIFTGDRGLHLFLQTSLTIEDIKYNLNGSRHDHVIMIDLFTPTIDFTPSPSRSSDLMAIGSSNEKRKENDAGVLSTSPTLSTTSDYSSTKSYSSILKPSDCWKVPRKARSDHVRFNELVRVLTVSSAIPVHKLYED